MGLRMVLQASLQRGHLLLLALILNQHVLQIGPGLAKPKLKLKDKLKPKPQEKPNLQPGPSHNLERKPNRITRDLQLA